MMSNGLCSFNGTVVAFVADQWEHVCPSVRIRAPLRYAGWEILPGNERRNDELRWHMEYIREADVVVVQRDLPRQQEAFKEILARSREARKPLVYEIDDLLLELPQDHPDYSFYRAARMAILWAACEADAITVSTSALKRYFEQFNTRVWVLPNYLIDDLWQEALSGKSVSKPEAEELIVGFMGGHGHISDLRLVEQVLVHILDAYPHVRFVSWGCPLPERLHAHPSATWIQPGIVDYAEFVQYFVKQTCDIFLAPLVPSTFNECKSALKFLEYSALGVAGIYSAIGAYKEVVRHGETGFLASTLEEWDEFLVHLIEHKEERLRMGQQARQAVREKWRLSLHASKWTEVYKRLSPSSSQRTFFLPLSMLATWYQEIEEERSSLEDRNQSHLEQIEQIESLQQYATFLQEQINILQAKNEELDRHIQTIIHSPGWKLLGMVWPLRARIIPPGTRREHFFYRAVQAPSLLRKRGIKALVRREPLSSQEEHIDGLPFAASISPASPTPPPLLSIVVEPAQIERAREWLATQTWHSGVELVLWDQRRQRAWKWGEEHAWNAPDVPSLLDRLSGKYVCLASDMLFHQRATYLEENIVVLEAEHLALTLNINLSSSVLSAFLNTGRIPVFPSSVFVRRELLRGFWAADLTRWESKVVGKVIPLPTPPSPFPSLSFELHGKPLTVRWPYLLDAVTPVEDTQHHLHQVTDVVRSALVSDSRPVVLLVMPFLAVGGAERIALDVIRYLNEEILFVVVATDPRDEALGSTAEAFREVTPYVYVLSDYLAPPLRLSFFSYLAEKFNPVTLYIANGSAWIYDQMLPAIKHQYPSLRTVNQVYDYRVGWINRYNRELIALLDAHIGPNRRICQEYIRRGAPAEQVHLVEHGVDVHQYNPANYPPERVRALRQQLQLPEDKRIVTFIARLHPQKRPMDFVELARRFSHDPSLVFLMVGDGPLAGTVDAEVQRIGLKNLIRRPFYHPSSDIFAVSDVIVLPSEYEGMPVVILEALAMGKPVVVTDVGNTREVVERTSGGVVVSRIGDVGALYEGVRHMLETPPNSQHMRRAVVEHYSWETIAPKYRHVLLGLSAETYVERPSSLEQSAQ